MSKTKSANGNIRAGLKSSRSFQKQRPERFNASSSGKHPVTRRELDIVNAVSFQSRRRDAGGSMSRSPAQRGGDDRASSRRSGVDGALAGLPRETDQSDRPRRLCLQSPRL